MTDAPTDEPTLTMRYANRFSCIGPACEDTCCAGWRIDVDKAHYERLLAAATFSAKPLAQRMKAAIRVVPPKTKRERERYLMKLDEAGNCAMLDAAGLCEVHKAFGISALWDVCAFYPRKLKYVGPTLELSLTASCPEVVRHMLLPDDGTALEPIDTTRLERRVIQDGLDPRDLRPYFRAYLALREFMLELWREPGLGLEPKYFLTAWFAKRTNDVLKRHVSSGDLAPVDREMALLRRAEVRRAILERFEQVETPAALVIWIIRAIVRPWGRDTIRSHWSRLADEVVKSYQRIETLVPSSTADVAAHDAAERRQGADVPVTTLAVWREYQRRRARVVAVDWLWARIERHFVRYMEHTWFHKMPVEAEDILHYVLRILVQHAAIRFILVSHPRTQAALDRWEARPPELAGDALAAERQALQAELDAVTVIAFQKIARHVEHGELLKNFNTMLKQADLFSIAGAVYLLRF